MTTEEPINRITLSRDNPEGILELPDGRCRVILRHESSEEITVSRENAGFTDSIDSIRASVDMNPSPSKDRQRKRARSALRKFIVESFNDGDLRTLCFDLGVNYDELSVEGISSKARDLILYLEYRCRLHDLLECLEEERPDMFSRIPVEYVRLLQESKPVHLI